MKLLPQKNCLIPFEITRGQRFDNTVLRTTEVNTIAKIKSSFFCNSANRAADLTSWLALRSIIISLFVEASSDESSCSSKRSNYGGGCQLRQSKYRRTSVCPKFRNCRL